MLAEGPIVSHLGTQWMDKDVELFSGAPRRGHYPVLQEVHKNMKKSETIPKRCLDWKNADWSKWADDIERSCLGISLQTGSSQNGKQQWQYLLEAIKDANKKHIPEKTISIHSKPYWSPYLTLLAENALASRTRYKQRSTPNNKCLLEESVGKYRNALVEEKNNWIRERVESLNISNSTQFWRRYKKVFGGSSDNSIYNLKDGDILVTTNEKKEELLFRTFFTGEHLKSQPKNSDYEKAIDQKFNSIHENEDNDENMTNQLNDPVTIQEIVSAIEKQKAKDKACDSDGIHPIILGNLKQRSLKTLQQIFNYCLTSGHWLWKTSNVTFIRKEGKSNYMMPGSYRPISVSSYIGKILERVIDNRIREFLGVEENVDEDQEGFIRERSTTRYLFRLLANLEEIKRQKLACIILFLDFEKAFDSVHLPTLMVKLDALGIKGKMFSLLKGFLFSRNVCLKVNQYKGNLKWCKLYGLPQGAVLSPLLFILFISDMVKNTPEEVKKYLNCYKFADDGTLMIALENINTCHGKMQELCDNLSDWCIRNKLVINCDVNKTEAIILKTKAIKNKPQPPELQINGKAIRYVKNTKVLGVVVDDELNFKAHALKKLNESNKKWGMITKSTNRNHGLNIFSLALLLKTMILTKIFYAAPIWLNRCLKFYDSFWNKIVMKISGSTLNPQREITELALHLPPLSVQLESITVKFICKILTKGDHLTAILYQVEASKTPHFQYQLGVFKRYLQWKEGQKHRIKSIDIMQQYYHDMATYNQEEIEIYRQKIWLENIQNKMLYKKISNHKTSKLFNLVSKMNNNNILLNKENFLFRHYTTKAEDSQIMDFIHGSSFFFGNIRYVMGESEDKTCYFCNVFIDSPEHQLFECPVVQDSSDMFPLESISEKSNEDYLSIFLTPTSKTDGYTMQLSFIKRIKFLSKNHKLIQDGNILAPIEGASES